MRRAVLLAAAILLLVSRGGFAVEQDVQEIVPPGEQQIQEIGPGGDEQGVRGVAEGSDQSVERQEPPSPAAKIAENVGHAAIAVGATVVSLGATAAMLMFL
jgi:hypothetical protein